MTNYSRPIRKSDAPKAIALFLLLALFNITSYGQATLIDESGRLLQHLNAIDDIEAEHSAYASELGELYMSLGQIHENRNEYPQALAAYQRGLQTERINFGLNAVSQTPYLMAVSDLELALGERKKAFDAIDSVYQINSQSYGELDARMAPVIQKLLSWHIKSYMERPPTEGFPHLIASETLADRLFAVLEQATPETTEQMIDQFNQISRFHFMVAEHLTRHGEPRETGVTFSTSSSVSQTSTPGTSHRHFQKGRDALKSAVRAVASDPDIRVRDQAEQIAQLGDWFLMFNQRSSAIKSYATASELLLSEENGLALEKELFGVPAIIELSSTENQKIPENGDSIKIKMTVSRTGVASQFESVNNQITLSNKDKNHLRRHFRGKRFRPVIVEGEPQTVEYIVNFTLPPNEITDSKESDAEDTPT